MIRDGARNRCRITAQLPPGRNLHGRGRVRRRNSRRAGIWHDPPRGPSAGAAVLARVRDRQREACLGAAALPARQPRPTAHRLDSWRQTNSPIPAPDAVRLASRVRKNSSNAWAAVASSTPIPRSRTRTDDLRSSSAASVISTTISIVSGAALYLAALVRKFRMTCST